MEKVSSCKNVLWKASGDGVRMSWRVFCLGACVSLRGLRSRYEVEWKTLTLARGRVKIARRAQFVDVAVLTCRAKKGKGGNSKGTDRIINGTINGKECCLGSSLKLVWIVRQVKGDKAGPCGENSRKLQKGVNYFWEFILNSFLFLSSCFLSSKSKIKIFEI